MGNTYLKDILIQSIYDTIDNIELWESVLRQFCGLTGATKAVITARSKPNSAIIISEQMSEDYASPLLYGFSEEDFTEYVEKYWEDDIWTEIEKAKHPISPYSLAKHLPLSELKKHRLWEWLEPQGISDSIVAEVYNGNNHWVGLNFYYNLSDEGVQKSILDLLNDTLPLMSKAWQLGQKIASAESFLSSGNQFIEHYDFAAILVEPPNTVVWSNQEARKLFADYTLGTIETGKVRFEEKRLQNWLIKHTNMSYNHKKTNHEHISTIMDSVEDHRLTINRLSKFDQLLGTSSPNFLLSIFPKGYKARTGQLSLLEHPSLTNQERALANHLSEGHTVRSFGKKSAISQHTADFHWRNLKKKLGINSPKDLIIFEGKKPDTYVSRSLTLPKYRH